MIRILHTADLHLGVRRIDRYDSNGLNVMIKDFLDTLDEMVEYAIYPDADGFPYIDIFLIAGDIYQHPAPSPTLEQHFAQRVKKLIEHKVQVVIIPGNHDKPITTTKSDPLQIFRILEINGCHVFGKPELKTIKVNRGEIEVLGFPYVSFKTLFAKFKYQNFSEKEIGDKYQDLVRTIILKHGKKASQDRLTLLMAHMHVLGATIGFERPLTMTTEPMLTPTSLLFPNCDLVCLGHIHKHQTVYQHPLVLYSGSPQRCDFGEENDKKGFIEYQWENNNLKWYFRETHAREYVTITCDVTTSEEPTEYVINHIESISNLKDAIVRVRITCLQKQTIRKENIQNVLSNAQLFHLYPIEITRINVVRSRAPGLSADDPFDEAVDMYLKTRKFNKEDSTRLKNLAIEYSKMSTKKELGEI